MGYYAKVIADSLTPDGVRVTTLEVRYPHAIHKDIMTHRALSRNYQSFRAFPPLKVIASIKEDPFVPEKFSSYAPGMGQGEEFDARGQMLAGAIWHEHVNHCIKTAQRYIDLKTSKDQVNFVLQDLTWITGVITATHWDNFWGLRLSLRDDGKPYARPEVYKAVNLMHEAYKNSTPQLLPYGTWHLPYVPESDYLEPYEPMWDFWKKISAARCGRVSYLTHDGKRDVFKDMDLYRSLFDDHHMSPFEHPTRPKALGEEPVTSNFDRRVVQYRKEIPGEDLYVGVYET